MEKVSLHCPYAFGGLTIRSNGSYSPCQRSSLSLHDVDAHEWTLTETFHAPPLQELRETLRSGQKHPACGRCWSQEAAGSKSLRMKALQDFGETSPPGLIALMPALGNLCGQSCLHCGNQGSSAWAPETEPLNQLPGRPFVRNFWGELTPQLSWTAKDLEHLEVLFLQETEALNQPAFASLMALLEKAGRLDKIKVYLEVSGGFLPEPKIQPWLEKISRLEIALSIDAYGDLNTYIRHPIPWNRVEASADFWQGLVASRPDWDLRGLSTVSVLNAVGLDGLRAWSRSRGLKDPILNQVHFPWYLSLDILSARQREELAARNEWDKVRALLLAPRPSRHDVSAADLARGLDRCREFLRQTDRHRGLSFGKAHPELAGYLFSSAPW